MGQMMLALKRTVFLPKGSPGICSVREIKVDIRDYETVAEGGRVFCTGEADLLVEYLSFAGGRQYPGYESYEQQLNSGGSMWQALLTVPFELTGEGELPCPPQARLEVSDTHWFMVSTHALEMEIALCLSWQEAAAERWRQITLADLERESESPHKLDSSETKTEGDCLKMEHEDKIMRVGVSDQGWQIVPEEASILEAALQEIAQPEIAQPEITIAEEEAVIEEVVEEELEEEPAEEPPAPEILAETESPAAPQPTAAAAARRRAAGLPRLHVCHEQIRRASYQVNIRIQER